MKVQFGEVVQRVKDRDSGATSITPNWGEETGSNTPNWGRTTPGGRAGGKGESRGEEIEKEEDRLRSEVQNIRMKGNLNLQQLGSILQGSEGLYNCTGIFDLFVGMFVEI